MLDKVDNNNAKREYYLTDIIALARRDGLACGVVEGRATELMGINSRVELAQAEQAVQAELRAQAMASGATLVDPATVFFSYDTRLGRDVVIGPFVVFATGVTVGDDVQIRGFCHFEGVTIEAGAQIGPFAKAAAGASISPGAHPGNFVEVKNATVETGAKVNHLTYIGDARIGSGANVGTGTITCNYDGLPSRNTRRSRGRFHRLQHVAGGAGGDRRRSDRRRGQRRDARCAGGCADAVAGAYEIEKDDWARHFREQRGAQKAALKSSNKS